MTINELRDQVLTVLDSRNLKQPSRRKNALEHVLSYIENSNWTSNGDIILPQDKEKFKQGYISHKVKNLNGAEKSAINEIYNQHES